MVNEGNLSTLDKVIRIIVVLVLIMIGFRSSYAWVYYAVSILLVVTVITDFCPLYYVLGISTAKSKAPKISKRDIHKAVSGTTVKKKTGTKKKSTAKRGTTKKKSTKKTTKKKSTKKTTKKSKSKK